MDWHAFFAMGGYAAFVWPSYALAAALLAANALAPHWRERRLLRRIHREPSRNPGRDPGGGPRP